MGIELGALSMGMTALSTATGAWSQYQQGRAQDKRMQYQAREQDIRADRIQYRGEWEEKRLRQEGARIKGKQRTAYAAGNVQVDTGSPLDILAGTDFEIERDAAMIRYNAEAEADAARSQAGLYRAAGKTARSDSLLSAGSTILTGGSGMLQQYDRFYGENRTKEG